MTSQLVGETPSSRMSNFSSYHVIHLYPFQLLGHPATCSLETVIHLGLQLEGRLTFAKGYEDVMGDNFTKKVR